MLGVLPGLVGTVQATETVKLLLGIGETLAGRLLIYDALRMRFSELKLRKDPDCPVCGSNPTVRELVDYDASCGVEPVPAGEPVEVTPLPETDFNISPEDLKARMDRGDKPFLLDVREPVEFQIARLEGATLIPVGELVARQGELDPDAEIIVYCHLGVRSANATAFLRSAGFAHARNLVGGIEAWSRRIDPSVSRY